MKIKRIILDRKKYSSVIVSSLILLILLIVSMAVLYHKAIISNVFTILLLALGCMSKQFKRMTGNLDFGIEFVTFATILFLYSHGIVFAIIASLLMMVVSSLSVGELKLDIFLSFGMFIILGMVYIVMVFIFPSISIVAGGIILVIAYNLLSIVVFSLLGFDLFKNVIYFAGSIIFNYILFRYFSVIILKVITLT